MRGTAIATSWRMFALVVVTGLMAGCASLSSSPPSLTPEEQCVRSNGAWRQVLNFCEHGR